MSGWKKSALLTSSELHDYSLRIVAAQNVDTALKRALVQVIADRNDLQKLRLKLGRACCVGHFEGFITFSNAPVSLL